jgi:diketogulonate reductase-like aldo/keto reductase
VAASHDVTPALIALAWVLRADGVIAIPKSADPNHVRENRRALDLQLTPEDLRDLDREFHPPSRKVPLELL